jgi:hypothetical protein
MMINIEDAHIQSITRLKVFRRILGITPPQMSKSLNISNPNYVRIEVGLSKITYDLIYQLMMVHKLNPAWLMSGEGEMLLESTSSNPIPKEGHRAP